MTLRKDGQCSMSQGIAGYVDMVKSGFVQRGGKPWLIDLVRSKTTDLQPVVSIAIERRLELARVRLKALVRL